jgi:hypothetical protein
MYGTRVRVTHNNPPAGLLASPRESFSYPLAHAYSTMAPMDVIGASFPTTPTSNRSARVRPWTESRP